MRLLGKILLSLGVLFLILYVGAYVIMLFCVDGLFDETVYSKEDLINNYELHKNDIFELKEFVEANLCDNVLIDLEFKDDAISRFHVIVDGIRKTHFGNVNEAELNIKLQEIGWDLKELNQLKLLLLNAGCISIKNSTPVTIGWKRSGMGMYFYQVFDNDLSNTLIIDFNSYCTQIFYKNNIGLQYGGGAIGPQCFPNK